MRHWFKYYLTPIQGASSSQGIDRHFQDHQKTMGGYEADVAYATQESFFTQYLWMYHSGRLAFYAQFLLKHLKKEWCVLSVASGRCANEMYLHENGYDVTCSDLEVFGAYPQTQQLFPALRWRPYNVLQGPFPRPFDAVMCLSLIYLFDDNDLDTFFQSVAGSLTPQGSLLLDSAGSPDNSLSWLIHDVLLKGEAYAKKIVFMLMRRGRPAVVKKHHGYRRTDRELIQAAVRNGFRLIAREDGAFLIDFERSSILGRIIKWHPLISKTFSILGRTNPYIRMFKFQRIAD